MGSRDHSKGSEAVSTLKALPIKGTVDSVHIDVTHDASVDAEAKHVLDKHGRLDVLVNNAGIISQNPNPREAYRETLAVNCVGALSVTEAFLPLLRRSMAPRLVFVSSSTGSISYAADPTSRYYRASANEHRSSKAALNMLIVQYAHKLGDEGFKVLGADPGLVATNFMDAEQFRKRAAAEPEVGGERVATVVKGERDVDVGRVCGEYRVLPW
ncbi:hypothetical protein MMC34_003479 [Xylographa carneopallida]|nr:hypothetical protein [Xylographa carneopallida]